MKRIGILIIVFAICQVLHAASIEDKYEPMVAFMCGRPAMHRGVNGWIADKSTDCLNRMEDILAYCKTMYPDHNITNVVEASYLVTIANWPMVSTDGKLLHHVRPIRCLEQGFQSDALLVPQHCEFDHRHDQSLCESFPYWNIVADEACKKKSMHLESFGMLLNCKLGKFSGVEYVCCPNQTEPNYQPPQNDEKPSNLQSSSEEDDYDEDSEEDDENTVDLYEAYLRGQDFPSKYNNEHKKFLAAKERMKKNQQRKITKLLQEWQAARDHVAEVRKSDPKTADTLNKGMTQRYQNLYTAYQQEFDGQQEQLVALHLQRVQANLNEKKREAMEEYLKALETEDVGKITKYLRAYIKAEEKDRLHTVNHYEYLKYSAPKEAARVRPFVVNHLHDSDRRMDQAMDMLKHNSEIEAKVRPVIEKYMTRFSVIGNSIRDIISSEPPKVDQETSTSQAAEINNIINSQNSNQDDDNINIDDSSNDELDPISHDDDDVEDIDDHDYERKNTFVAHHMQDTHHVKQGFAETAASSSQVGSTVGIVLGSVSVFVIIVVAIIMLKRSKSRQSLSHGYVESDLSLKVDPSASPEEKHLANMQMNGYENPTYKYFEVQNNPKA